MSNIRISGNARSRAVRSSKSSDSSSGSSSKKWIAAIVLLLLLICTAGWAMWGGTDPHQQRIAELRSQMDGATPEQARELRGQLREEFQQLTPEAREAMWEERRKEWEAREYKRMNEFFAMTDAEQNAAIDKQLDEWDRRKKERGQRQPGDRGGNRGPGNFQGGPPGGGGPGGRGGGGGGDPMQRRKDYLDKSTPEQRAQRAEYRRKMEERRKARG